MSEAIHGDPKIDEKMAERNDKLRRLSNDFTIMLREHSTLKNLSKEVLQDICRACAEIQASVADNTLQQVLNRLPHEKVRCVDVETTGLDWRQHCIVGYVLCFGPRDAD